MNPPGISDYVDQLQRQGRYGFDRRELEASFSNSAILKALNRLAKKNRVLRIRKGFYAIIPLEFSSKGIIPPDWFIDDLMRYLGCPYYIGLQSAAALHGAAHQQIQEFQVVTPRQQLPIQLHQLTIRFFRKQDFDSTKTQMIKGHSGMLPVSTPEATALDLVRYANRIGGADAVITLLEELVESLSIGRIREIATKKKPTLQQLGWFLDRINARDLADALHASLSKPLPRAKLDPSSPWHSSDSKNRWRVVENIQPVSDL